jgi:hypothetical protein
MPPEPPGWRSAEEAVSLEEILKYEHTLTNVVDTLADLDGQRDRLKQKICVWPGLLPSFLEILPNLPIQMTCKYHPFLHVERCVAADSPERYTLLPGDSGRPSRIFWSGRCPCF